MAIRKKICKIFVICQKLLKLGKKSYILEYVASESVAIINNMRYEIGIEQRRGLPA